MAITRRFFSEMRCTSVQYPASGNLEDLGTSSRHFRGRKRGESREKARDTETVAARGLEFNLAHRPPYQV
jgi:hypothetical protein